MKSGGNRQPNGNRHWQTVDTRSFLDGPTAVARPCKPCPLLFIRYLLVVVGFLSIVSTGCLDIPDVDEAKSEIIGQIQQCENLFDRTFCMVSYPNQTTVTYTCSDDILVCSELASDRFDCKLLQKEE